MHDSCIPFSFYQQQLAAYPWRDLINHSVYFSWTNGQSDVGYSTPHTPYFNLRESFP